MIRQSFYCSFLYSQIYWHHSKINHDDRKRPTFESIQKMLASGSSEMLAHMSLCLTWMYSESFFYYIWEFITAQFVPFVMILIYYIYHNDSFWNLICRVWGAVQILPYHSTMCHQVKCMYWNISSITCGHMEFLTMLIPRNCQALRQNLHPVESTIQQRSRRRRRRLTRPK